MAYQSVLCCPPGQVNPLHRTRTSILRPSELVEIQGSYWPRILVVSESGLKRKKTNKEPVTKVSRRIKKKMELIRQLKHVKSTTSPQQPISPTLEASSLSTFDQNTSPCWKPTSNISRKTSSFTGRPVFPQLDNTPKSIQQTSSGLKGPRRKKSLKGVVAAR
eukprot:CAMPEP_0116151746 /NCGR_PEP_ID=MMETSP0329-20121206/20267_1 /TAXON_ID=697910 /ORGANISM="Pseudo-nitzschia arenysensis, Strain B593" /LENGTH=161 /DNA_ID=CAMNT_0003648391 /DNA_START=121 /DNA_END=606 /DNA_ORIENTATION=-